MSGNGELPLRVLCVVVIVLVAAAGGTAAGAILKMAGARLPVALTGGGGTFFGLVGLGLTAWQVIAGS